jgi:hypothetical protein
MKKRNPRPSYASLHRSSGGKSKTNPFPPSLLQQPTTPLPNHPPPPPAPSNPPPTDLELYTTRTDAFCLLALSAILLTVSDAIPLPTGYTGSQLASSTTSTATKRPYARAVIAITMLHHVATGLGAATHWWYDSHNTVAMEIGVYGNVGLVVLGVAALMVEETRGGVVGGKKRA